MTTLSPFEPVGNPLSPDRVDDWLGVVEMIHYSGVNFSRKSPSKFYDVHLHLAGSRPHGHQFPSVLLPYSIIFYDATMTTGMYGLGRSKSSRIVIWQS